MPSTDDKVKVRDLEVTDKPVEALLSFPELAQILLRIIETGRSTFEFVDPDWARLAVSILALCKENMRLKALLGGKTINHTLVPDLHVSYDLLRLNFGPQGDYELSVPVKENQEELAARSQTVANELKKQIKLKESSTEPV